MDLLLDDILLDPEKVLKDNSNSKLSWEFVDQRSEQNWRENSSLMAPRFAEKYEGRHLLGVGDKGGREQALKTAKEQDLIKDIAFLLCGWESNSIKRTGDHGFELNDSLAFHISRTTVVRVVEEVSVTAEKVIVLEQKCSSSSALNSEDYIHTAFVQGILQCLKLHRDFVLAMSTRFKILSSFLKTVRKSCVGVTFLYDLCFSRQNGLHSKSGIYLLQSLCAISDSVHENFLKKMTNFLIKKALTTYLRFVDLALRGCCQDDTLLLIQTEESAGSQEQHNQDAIFLWDFHINVCNVVRQLPYLSYKDTAFLVMDSDQSKPGSPSKREKVKDDEKAAPTDQKQSVQSFVKPVPENLAAKLEEKWKPAPDPETEKAKEDLQKDLASFYQSMSSLQNIKFQLISWKLKRAALNAKRRGIQTSEQTARKAFRDKVSMDAEVNRVLPDILELTDENIEEVYIRSRRVTNQYLALQEEEQYSRSAVLGRGMAPVYFS